MDCVDSIDAWDCAVRPQPAPEPEPELPVALLVAGLSSSATAPADGVGTTVVPIVGGVPGSFYTTLLGARVPPNRSVFLPTSDQKKVLLLVGPPRVAARA